MRGRPSVDDLVTILKSANDVTNSPDRNLQGMSYGCIMYAHLWHPKSSIMHRTIQPASLDQWFCNNVVNFYDISLRWKKTSFAKFAKKFSLNKRWQTNLTKCIFVIFISLVLNRLMWGDRLNFMVHNVHSCRDKLAGIIVLYIRPVFSS